MAATDSEGGARVGATGVTKDSAGRFVLVGGTTVLIDAVVYQLLLVAGLPHGAAKASSFIAGAVFAYLANWRYTFRGQHHRWSLVAFIAVYLCALGINVGGNALVLHVVGSARTWQVGLAFVVFGERLLPVQLLGGGLVLASVVLLQRR